MIRRSVQVVAAILSCAGLLAIGQPRASAASPAPSACAAREMHQFDFWIGTWDVADQSGGPAGTNTIKPVVEGCALHEAWAAPGEIGESFSIYDPTTKRWHQTWVDNKAHLWMIDGGMVGASMVMTRTTPAKANPKSTVLHRWTWTPSDKDHVRQLYDVSADGGKTWKILFDGRYVRRKG